MNVYSFLINLNDKKDFINQNVKFRVANNNQYIEFSFEIQNTKILFYKSNKVVVQGKNASDIMKKYFLNYFNNEESTNKMGIQQDLNKYEYLVGSDEVGVGDYFGGLVVCAVSLTKSMIGAIQTLGVNDSKKLTDDKILQIAPKLMEIVDYKIAEISAEQYNILVDKYNNSHILKTLLHNRALLAVTANRRSQSFVILDQFAESKNYYQYLKKLQEPYVVSINLFETKAESKYLCVACASVIARYYFLKQIQQLGESINMTLPLGAWNPNIEKAAIFLKDKVGFENLKYFVKLHFKNTEKIK